MNNDPQRGRYKDPTVQRYNVERCGYNNTTTRPLYSGVRYPSPPGAMEESLSPDDSQPNRTFFSYLLSQR